MGYTLSSCKALWFFWFWDWVVFSICHNFMCQRFKISLLALFHIHYFLKQSVHVETFAAANHCYHWDFISLVINCKEKKVLFSTMTKSQFFVLFWFSWAGVSEFHTFLYILSTQTRNPWFWGLTMDLLNGMILNYFPPVQITDKSPNILQWMIILSLF